MNLWSEVRVTLNAIQFRLGWVLNWSKKSGWRLSVRVFDFGRVQSACPCIQELLRISYDQVQFSFRLVSKNVYDCAIPKHDHHPQVFQLPAQYSPRLLLIMREVKFVFAPMNGPSISSCVLYFQNIPIGQIIWSWFGTFKLNGTWNIYAQRCTGNLIMVALLLASTDFLQDMVLGDGLSFQMPCDRDFTSAFCQRRNVAKLYFPAITPTIFRR